MSCAPGIAFTDDKVQGRVTVHIVLVIGADGTIETADVQKSPSDSLAAKIHDQMMTWLFEPPTNNGQPIRAKTEFDDIVNVIKQK